MRTLFTSLLGVFLLAACSSAPTPSTGEDDIKGRPDPNVKKLLDRANCAAGNSVHETVRFNPARFDAAAALADMKKGDRERGCPGREYSQSRAEGVKAFTATFLKEARQAFIDQCQSADENINAAQLERDLRDLVSDPANLGVFSSLHDDRQKDDPVHCAIFRFHVYRADGTLAKFDFDWSD
jgi:hypothetical protein